MIYWRFRSKVLAILRRRLSPLERYHWYSSSKYIRFGRIRDFETIGANLTDLVKISVTGFLRLVTWMKSVLVDFSFRIWECSGCFSSKGNYFDVREWKTQLVEVGLIRTPCGGYGIFGSAVWRSAQSDFNSVLFLFFLGNTAILSAKETIINCWIANHQCLRICNPRKLLFDSSFKFWIAAQQRQGYDFSEIWVSKIEIWATKHCSD